MTSPNTIRAELAAHEKAIAEIIAACQRLMDQLTSIDAHPSTHSTTEIMTEDGKLYRLRSTDAGWEVQK